ncbi:S41 family peptidase [Microtetraspora sp. NBRC 16547]|uniref:S41 family peptidase n=1 Tax=Microtetraspora sp. NBRC 16547 TaxID=3030993 RepID=UPI0024A5D3AB|nr:S41 family peptidase [Microtetraspora sp. NBRC 16547]GLX00156.1 biopolymer transporter TolR [Microtetraspora sp. NBRC 16547]
MTPEDTRRGGMSGYFRFPTIFRDVIVFACEDDLWMVHADGGRAFRLTAGVAEATYPRFSPDGTRIAFVGREEGPEEVYVMPADGGATQRVTFHGASSVVTGWDPAGAIVYASDERQPFDGYRWLHRVHPGDVPERLPYGPAGTISYGTVPGQARYGMVLGRNTADPARWKRYRGGTVGDLWVDMSGRGAFQRLILLPGNLASPCWVGDRIYFLSDHEGIGNVYSCTPQGEDLRRHTDHGDYYARNLSSDGHRLVYHAHAAVYLLDPATGESHEVDVRLGSSRTQRNRRFVPASEYLDTATLSPDGSGLAVTARGKAFSFANWEGPVRRHGEQDGVRYRFLTWLNDNRRLIAAASDDGDREVLVILTADGETEPIRLDSADTGRVNGLVVCPAGDRVAVTNHRNELLVVDLSPLGDGREVRVTEVEASLFGRIEDPEWSPDGSWLAYACPTSPQATAIKLFHVETGETFMATLPLLVDHRPSFDPGGRYLYFIGQRAFSPVYDQVQFDLGFPLGTRPYAITLRPDVRSPFVPEPRPLSDSPTEGVSEETGRASEKTGGTSEETERASEKTERASEKTGGTSEKTGGTSEKTGGTSEETAGPVVIETAGLTDRIVAFPVPEGRYGRIAGLDGKVVYTTFPVLGGPAALRCYDFAKQKAEVLATGLTDFQLGRDRGTLLYRAGDRLRVVKAGEEPPDDDTPSRTSGWIDLNRVKVSVAPDAEWRQMFREAWRLQREHFWDEDMAGIDWEAVYDRYLPLVDRVTTRGEFSDLLWELLGELGTSHAYETGGEYRERPHYWQGQLGVDWSYRDGRYVVARIVCGDRWDPDATSPLNRPGVDVRPGDAVIAINGQPLGVRTTPNQLLVNLADEEVELTVERDGETRSVIVRALADETPGRYRDWVTANRRLVHERTKGRVGYLHIPDMGPHGFAEFHRGYLAEYDREGLIVDVRFNGGGNVSALLLEKLSRKRLGYDFPRWGVPEPYPPESPRGPLVAVTNEWAGSDGDIFCHTFKLLKLGTLVGKRTWGGVVGIWPRHHLADGTVTTQPEFSFAFDDVGWRIENYGTDPDIEVDITPQEYALGVDSQLDAAIDVALERLAVSPPHNANPADRPRPITPTLPPRA